MNAGTLTAAGVELRCPACGAALGGDQETLRCAGCSREFPLVLGIPDLRLSYPDPYLSAEADVERARELADRFDERDLLGMLREHWRRSGKRPELAERFVARDDATIDTSAAYVDRIERRRGRRLGPDDRFLEVGCGTAGLAAVAAGRGARVVAGDVSMRWLVLAKKRLSEAGVDGVDLVCFAAEEPPFAAATFEVAGASDVIEHVEDPGRFVAGCARVLRPGGILFMATPNRFSLGLEPHVRLWGVGFLPRPLAERYVRMARKTSYDHIRLLSARGLRRSLASGALRPEIECPEIPASSRAMYSGIEARLVRAYNRVRRMPGVRRLLLVVGPFFHVFGTKERTR